MVTFQNFSPSAKFFLVPKVTVRPPSGRWTSRSKDKGGYHFNPPKNTFRSPSGRGTSCQFIEFTEGWFQKVTVRPQRVQCVRRSVDSGGRGN